MRIEIIDRTDVGSSRSNENAASEIHAFQLIERKPCSVFIEPLSVLWMFTRSLVLIFALVSLNLFLCHIRETCAMRAIRTRYLITNFIWITKRDCCKMMRFPVSPVLTLVENFENVGESLQQIE